MVAAMAFHPSSSAVASWNLAMPNPCMAASSRMGEPNTAAARRMISRERRKSRSAWRCTSFSFSQVVEGRVGDDAR